MKILVVRFDDFAMARCDCIGKKASIIWNLKGYNRTKMVPIAPTMPCLSSPRKSAADQDGMKTEGKQLEPDFNDYTMGAE
jgi:hypothetical protein